MHGFEEPNISYRDSLQQLPTTFDEAFDLVLANPPFAGSLDKDAVDVFAVVHVARQSRSCARLRRSQPTVHVAFGEDVAMLAAVALLAGADWIDSTRERVLKAIDEIHE